MQMAKFIKCKLYLTQKSNTTWLVTTIKRLIIKPVKKLGKPVFYLKRTHEAAQKNSQILAAFKGNLGSAIEAQKVIPLDYGSEFRDINVIKNLFCYHDEKERIFDIIQKGSRYHLSPIKEAAQKLDLEAMLLRGNQK